MELYGLLSTDELRFLRYYTRYLHHRLGSTWCISQADSYDKKSFQNNLSNTLDQLKDNKEYDFKNEIMRMNKFVKNDLVDESQFEWINSDRKSCFIWSLLKIDSSKSNLDLYDEDTDHSFNQRNSHLCFNTSRNLWKHIVFEFDSSNTSYSSTTHRGDLKHFGVSRTLKELKLKEGRNKFNRAFLNNKIKWISQNNIEQTKWIYNYIENKSDKRKFDLAIDFSFISPPASRKQFYNTVVAQLDIIFTLYNDPNPNWQQCDLSNKAWNNFLLNLKKAWSAYSTRGKVKVDKIELDKQSIKMLRDLVDKDASDAVLKKKLKDLIKVEHTEHKENLRRDKFNKRFKLPTPNVDSHSDV